MDRISKIFPGAVSPVLRGPGACGMDRQKNDGMERTQMMMTKENAIDICSNHIMASLTYQRLTAQEAHTWHAFLRDIRDDIDGTANQRYDQIMSLYRSFVHERGYNGPDWRQ